MRLPASGRVVCGRRVAGVADFMAATFAPDGPSWPVGEVASPLLLWARRSGSLLLLLFRRRQQYEVSSRRRLFGGGRAPPVE